MSKRTQDGQKKNATSPFKIPEKEMILTRGRTNKLQRQLRTKTPSRPALQQTRTAKSPPSKQIVRPAQQKTKSPKKNKILLKPPQKLTQIITDKRKSACPKKAVGDRSEVEKKNKPSAPRSLKQRVLDDRGGCSFAELVRARELEELTDEDLLEIVTCPSPVWWEDPPDSRYDEDPIFVRKRSPQKISDGTQKETENEDDFVIPEILESKCEEKFLKKRSLLENVLQGIKMKGHITNENNENKLSNVPVGKTVDSSNKSCESKGIEAEINLNKTAPIVTDEVIKLDDENTETDNNLKDEKITDYVCDTTSIVEKSGAGQSYKENDSDSCKIETSSDIKEDAKSDIKVMDASGIKDELKLKTIQVQPGTSKLSTLNFEKLKNLKMEIAKNKIEDYKFKIVKLDVKNLLQKMHSHLPNVKCVTADTMKSIVTNTNEAKKIFPGQDSAELIPNKPVTFSKDNNETVTLSDSNSSSTQSTEESNSLNKSSDSIDVECLNSSIESEECIVIDSEENDNIPFLEKLESKETLSEVTPEPISPNEEINNLLVMGIQNYEDISNYDSKYAEGIELKISTTLVQRKDQKKLNKSKEARQSNQSELRKAASIPQLKSRSEIVTSTDEVIDFNTQYSHEIEIPSEITSNVASPGDISENLKELDGDSYKLGSSMSENFNKVDSTGLTTDCGGKSSDEDLTIDDSKFVKVNNSNEPVMCKPRKESEHNYHHLPESPVKVNLTEQNNTKKRKCVDNLENKEKVIKTDRIQKVHDSDIEILDINDNSNDDMKINESRLNEKCETNNDNEEKFKSSGKISRIRNVYKELVSKMNAQNNPQTQTNIIRNISETKTDFSNSLNDELSKTASSLSQMIKTPEKSDTCSKNEVEYDQPTVYQEMDVKLTKEMIDNIIGVKSGNNSDQEETITFIIEEEEENAENMMKEQTDNLKYCYKCSSLNDTEPCSYCIKQIDGFNKSITKTYTCNSCEFKCKNRYYMEKHALKHSETT